MKKMNSYREDLSLGRALCGPEHKSLLRTLQRTLDTYRLSLSRGDLTLLNGTWYVTHVGLLRLAARKHCLGIRVQPVMELSDARSSRYAFRAVVYTSAVCKGFVGYGDADPSNVSPLVHGAEMRVAETRAVNRALRKAYGVGICSVEELGSASGDAPRDREIRKIPPETIKSNGTGAPCANGNGSRVRDRLCQIIRRYELDAELVKAYAVDFCGTKTLREASREQVENFVAHLADWAEKDRNALLCQLNSYARPQQEGAA